MRQDWLGLRTKQRICRMKDTEKLAYKGLLKLYPCAVQSVSLSGGAQPSLCDPMPHFKYLLCTFAVLVMNPFDVYQHR